VTGIAGCHRSIQQTFVRQTAKLHVFAEFAYKASLSAIHVHNRKQLQHCSLLQVSANHLIRYGGMQKAKLLETGYIV
jgi:hypothetical protein